MLSTMSHLARHELKALWRAGAEKASWMAVLVTLGAVSSGFLIAAGYIYVASMVGHVSACLIFASVFLAGAVLVGLIMRHRQKVSQHRDMSRSDLATIAGIAASLAPAVPRDRLGSIIGIAAAGYVWWQSQSRPSEQAEPDDDVEAAMMRLKRRSQLLERRLERLAASQSKSTTTI